MCKGVLYRHQEKIRMHESQSRSKYELVFVDMCVFCAGQVMFKCVQIWSRKMCEEVRSRHQEKIRMHESQSRSGLIKSHYPTYYAATCSTPIHTFTLHAALNKWNIYNFLMHCKLQASILYRRVEEHTFHGSKVWFWHFTTALYCNIMHILVYCNALQYAALHCIVCWPRWKGAL